MPLFRLHISTPEKLFFNDDVESVILTSIEGELGVLSGHIPMVTALATGVIKIRAGGEWKTAVISGGFAEIKNDEVVVLADTAEWPEEIEINRAMEAKKRAEERIRLRENEVEYVRSVAALQRAITRLRVVRRLID